MSSAVAQIIRCYYHQHPECYGRGEVPEPVVPIELRYGREDVSALVSLSALPVEAMGDPEAVPV